MLSDRQCNEQAQTTRSPQIKHLLPTKQHTTSSAQGNHFYYAKHFTSWVHHFATITSIITKIILVSSSRPHLLARAVPVSLVNVEVVGPAFVPSMVKLSTPSATATS